MLYGLNEYTIKKLQSVFKEYDQISKVVLYGSRAKGNFKNGSDIDLALFGEIDSKSLYKINEEIDNLLLPYKTDITIFRQINNIDLQAHIKRAGVDFYQSP